MARKNRLVVIDHAIRSQVEMDNKRGMLRGVSGALALSRPPETASAPTSCSALNSSPEKQLTFFL